MSAISRILRRRQTSAKASGSSTGARPKSKKRNTTIEIDVTPTPTPRPSTSSSITRSPRSPRKKYLVRNASMTSSAQGSPRKRQKKKGKTLRQKLRETVLEEGDDWRQRLRQVEEKNRVLQDKLQIKKQSLKTHKQEHKQEIEDLTSKFNAQVEKEVDKHSKEKSKMEKELKSMRKRAERAELDLSKAESLKSSVATNAGGGSSEAFFQDILVNLKDFLGDQLQCSICNEIYVYPTSINCGHSYCEDCIEGWRKKSTNTTCPICRADVVMLSPNQVLDGFIEKFVDNFFPEDAKQQRQELVKERKVKKEARAAQNQNPVLSAGTRRRILNLDSGGDDDSWDGHDPVGVDPAGIANILGILREHGMETPSSPSNSSINSIPSTTSDNMSFTPERSPFFSDSEDDDSYQPGQEVGDFDLSHLDELDQFNESDRFSNEDHEDVEEDDVEVEDDDDDDDTAEYNGEEGNNQEESDDDDSVEHDDDDSDQYDSPTFSDSDY